MEENGEVKFSLGELYAKIDGLERKVDKIQTDVDSLNAYRANLVGIGASISFFIMAVGFLFGDAVRSVVKKLTAGY